MKIGILLDSGSGAIEEELKETCIEVIPLHIIVKNEKEIFDTKEEILKNNIYELIKEKDAIRTSMASIGELEEKYDSMLKKYDHIVHFTITPNLSSMYETAKLLSLNEKFKGKVAVIKHNIAANALKYIALYIDKKIKEDNISIEQIQENVSRLEKEIIMLIVPGDFSKLSKGGRTKSMLTSFLKMFKAKFLIQWGEKPSKLAMGRTAASLYEKNMDKVIKSNNFNNGLFLLVHSPETNEKIIKQCELSLSNLNIKAKLELVPNIYVCHAGVDTTGVIFMPKEIL